MRPELEDLGHDLRCGSCEHFQAFQEVLKGIQAGHCRCAPPQVVGVDGRIKTIFPTVRADHDYCAEHTGGPPE